MTDLRNVNVIADYEQKSEVWKKYGFIELPVMNTNVKGEMVGPSGMKIEIQKTNDIPEPIVRCCLPAGQAFVPFEAIDEIVEGLEKRLIDTFPDMAKQEFKIEEVIEKYSSNGNTKHWIIQTNITETIKDSYKPDDQVKLGFCIRNGYNTGVSLGVDLFTFRLICSNGAFAKGVDLAATSIRHIGKDPKALLKIFQTGLMQIVEEWTELLSVYNKMAKTKLTEKMANYIYETTRKASWDMSNRFFPEYYAIATPEEIKANPKVPVIALTASGKSVTLWENFNDMTYELWRAQDETELKDKEGNVKTDKDGFVKMRKAMAFDGIVSREKTLHDSIKFVLDNPGDFK